MTWIETLDREEASGLVGALYEEFSRGDEGTVSEIVKVHSLNERAMRSFAAFSELLFTESGLEREVKEMINTVVSVHNDCHY